MESVGELIEKLVIANIKLWMLKDAQTALACKTPADLKELKNQLLQITRAETLGTKGEPGIEELKQMVSALEKALELGKNENLQLFKDLLRKDIELCEARAFYRRSINQRLQDTTPADTVKKYGERN